MNVEFHCKHCLKPVEEGSERGAWRMTILANREWKSVLFSHICCYYWLHSFCSLFNYVLNFLLLKCKGFFFTLHVSASSVTFLRVLSSHCCDMQPCQCVMIQSAGSLLRICVCSPSGFCNASGHDFHQKSWWDWDLLDAQREQNPKATWWAG